jgi:hypothetical protein
MWRRVSLVKIDLSEERIASIFRAHIFFCPEDPHGATLQKATVFNYNFVFGIK